MRGEHGHRALGDLGLAVDEDRAALAQRLDDVLVVDDLLADVDGRAVALERPLDRLDRAIDARAVAARGGEQDLLDACWSATATLPDSTAPLRRASRQVDEEVLADGRVRRDRDGLARGRAGPPVICPESR